MKILAVEFSSPQRSVAVIQAPGGSQGQFMKGAGTASSPLLVGPQEEEPGTKPSPPLAMRLHELALGGSHGPGVIADSESALDNSDHRCADALRLVEQALRKAQIEREEIECVAVGIGPGSYTGIRAAIALAQGWQLARGVKLLAIGSAECLAEQARAEGLFGRLEVVIDAQRNEFYLAGYDISPAASRQTQPLRLATLAEVQERQRAGGKLIGPETSRWFPGSRDIFPDAATLGRLALDRSDFIPGEDLQPIYLRETKFVKHRR